MTFIFIHMLSFMLQPTCPVNHPCICAFIHSFIRSFVHSFVCYLTCERDILTTNEPIVMAVDTSGLSIGQGHETIYFGVRRSKSKSHV